MCRFYLLLAGAVGKRQGIAIPYPSPTPLLTPGGYPLRRGISAAAVDRDLVSLYPVQIAYPQVRIRFFYLCSGWGFSRFSRFRLACIVRFSLVVDRLYVPAATWRFAMVYRLPRNVLRANPTKEKAKHHVAAEINSLSPQ